MHQNVSVCPKSQFGEIEWNLDYVAKKKLSWLSVLFGGTIVIIFKVLHWLSLALYTDQSNDSYIVSATVLSHTHILQCLDLLYVLNSVGYIHYNDHPILISLFSYVGKLARN